MPMRSAPPTTTSSTAKQCATWLGHGFYASFAPKPFADQAGNGCHIHFSAWDRDVGHNPCLDPVDPLNLSRIAYQFIGGVLEHPPGLVALTCPSMNSYRRLAPGSWSSVFACYGPGNREAALRVPSLFWGEEMATSNLELKASDPVPIHTSPLEG